MGFGLQQSPGVSNTAVETTLEAIAGFFKLPFDEMDIAYVTAGNGIGEIETVTTKLGGTTVEILTLTYNSDDLLIKAIVT